MKLELKHLAPYLPYGLKAKNTDASAQIGHEWMGIKTIIGLHSDTVIQSMNNFPYMIKFDISKIKPILRPLSDLTKEIEHNGEKFIPIYKFWELAGFEVGRGQYIQDTPNYIKTSNLGTAQEFRIYKTDILSSNYNVVEKLFEWHFDVFGLIPDLAIDINTLK